MEGVLAFHIRLALCISDLTCGGLLTTSFPTAASMSQYLVGEMKERKRLQKVIYRGLPTCGTLITRRSLLQLSSADRSGTGVPADVLPRLRHPDIPDPQGTTLTCQPQPWMENRLRRVACCHSIVTKLRPTSPGIRTTPRHGGSP